MKRHGMVFFLCAFLLALAHQAVHAAPPFSGTIFIGPEIITPADPTAFRSVSFAGRGQRTMFDRRVNDWVNVDRGAEVRVGDRSTADRAPDRREDRLDSPGRKPIWGGNNNLLIHTGQAGIYLADGILEETLVHEAAHTSLDADHASAAGWVAAQSADGDFISTYARDFPRREDMAESFLLLPGGAVSGRSNLAVVGQYDIADDPEPDRLPRQSTIRHVPDHAASDRCSGICYS